jgi:hypothetical protein
MCILLLSGSFPETNGGGCESLLVPSSTGCRRWKEVKETNFGQDGLDCQAHDDPDFVSLSRELDFTRTAAKQGCIGGPTGRSILRGSVVVGVERAVVMSTFDDQLVWYLWMMVVRCESYCIYDKPYSPARPFLWFVAEGRERSDPWYERMSALTDLPMPRT